MKRFIQDIFERVRGLIQSSDGCRRMGGVLAVDELGETKVFGDSMSRLSDLIRILMDAFVFGVYPPGGERGLERHENATAAAAAVSSASMEMKTMRLASEVLGRLVTIGGWGCRMWSLSRCSRVYSGWRGLVRSIRGLRG